MYIAIIPARAGSKGIPGKNLRSVAGKPLIAWSIEHALACERIARTIVSTDDESIARIAEEFGAQVPFIRPKHLAEDTTPTEPVLLHAMERLAETGSPPEAIVLLQPTSPIRRRDSLDRAIELFETTQADSLVSVNRFHRFLWRSRENPQALYDFRNRPRRQDVVGDRELFVENGSIYITKREILAREGCRLGGKIAMFEMAEEEGLEIDSPLELRIANLILESMRGRDADRSQH